MSQFNVKPDQLAIESGNFGRCSGQLRGWSQNIRQIQFNLQLEGSSASNIKRSLGMVSESVLDEAVKMNSLRSALETIAQAYQTTEAKVVDSYTDEQDLSDSYGINNASDSDVNKYITSKPWELINLFIKYWNDKEKLAEAIQDHYMSYAAQNLLNDDRFSEETWKNANLDERKAMLVSLIAELNAIMGINVEWCAFKHLGSHTRGQYSPDNNNVSINLDYIDPANNNADSYKIMRTMIHEMRHAYQHAAITNPDQYYVSAETRNQWAENFKAGNYKSATRDGYDAYVQQPIEYDAKRFAGQYEDIKGYTPTYAGTW